MQLWQNLLIRQQGTFEELPCSRKETVLNVTDVKCITTGNQSSNLFQSYDQILHHRTLPFLIKIPCPIAQLVLCLDK